MSTRDQRMKGADTNFLPHKVILQDLDLRTEACFCFFERPLLDVYQRLIQKRLELELTEAVATFAACCSLNNLSCCLMNFRSLSEYFQLSKN